MLKNINEPYLKNLKDSRDKDKIGYKLGSLIKESRKVLFNLYQFTKSFKVNELSSVLLSAHNWQQQKKKFNKKEYKVRDIVLVDLGLGYGYEMSYQHPCIVLHDSRDGFCFVIPCSTGKYNLKNKHVIKGEVTDGFAQPTGILIDAVCCISKVRIIGKVGEVTVPFLDKVNDALLKIYFSRKYHKLSMAEKDMAKLDSENQLLKQQIKQLQEKISKTAG